MNRFSRWVGYFLLAASMAASSCGSSSGPLTKGEYCSRLAGPTCDRAIACGIGTASQRSYCLTEFQASCCQDDGTCGQTSTSEQQMELETIISECSAALATFDCTELADRNAPIACGGTSTSYVAARLPSLKTDVASTSRQLGAAGRQRFVAGH